VIPPFSYYIFDVDGTLLDSAADICGAVQTVLQATSRPDVPFEFLKGYIGKHLQVLFEDLFPGVEQAQIDEWIREYRAVYPARGHRLTRLYPGVAETLARLGGRKSTATTKGTPMTNAILTQFGLAPYFHHIQGTDGFPSKPKPDVLLRSMEALGARPEEVLFVGDSGPDMEAGRAAGVKLCAVLYGYGTETDMLRYKPEYVIRAFAELAPNGR
jgi:HAD superfamily hydrolase (TIGR01509 family)